MQISKQFQGKIFGGFIDDLFNNHAQFKIPEFVWDDGTPIIIKKYEDYHDSDMLRWFLKIFDENYPKHENGKPWSYANVSSNTLVKHLEYMRLVLAYNGESFKEDLEEWDRLISQYNR